MIKRPKDPGEIDLAEQYCQKLSDRTGGCTKQEVQLSGMVKNSRQVGSDKGGTQKLISPGLPYASKIRPSGICLVWLF